MAGYRCPSHVDRVRDISVTSNVTRVIPTVGPGGRGDSPAIESLHDH